MTEPAVALSSDRCASAVYSRPGQAYVLLANLEQGTQGNGVGSVPLTGISAPGEVVVRACWLALDFADARGLSRLPTFGAMNRLFRVAGFSACFLAILLASGGHWAVLQSVAWARMIFVYSRDNSLAKALAMTFDGRHPCKMCRQIQKARQAEDKAPPLVKWDRQPEFPPAGRRVAVPVPGIADAPLVAFVAQLHADFLPAPPKPPPRAV